MNPTAFISYCWDTPSEKNEQWVINLAERLKSDGVKVQLDKWAVQPGDPIAPFMQKAIVKSDKVLIVCTPNYKLKADDETGAVGYESNIIAAQIWLTADHRKYITILKEGNDLTSVPIGLQGKCHIRLNDVALFEPQYQVLLQTILRKNADKVIDKPGNKSVLPSNDDYNNLSFSILQQVGNEGVRRYIAHYRERITANRADARAYFGIGLCYLHLSLFDLACRQFGKAVSLAPATAEYHYYYAVSLVKGKKLLEQPQQTIKQIQQHVECALQLDNQQAKYYCFLLMVHFEYYSPLNKIIPGWDIEMVKIKSRDLYRDDGEIERLASLLKIETPLSLSLLLKKDT